MAAERREEERAALEAQAFRLLEQAEELEPRMARQSRTLMLRLWHYPSFDAHRSWTVVTSHRTGAPPPYLLVREVTWDRLGDSRRLTDPLEGLKHGFHSRPSLAVRDAEIAPASLDSFLRTAPLLSFPIIGIGGPVGLDGESFGIECGDLFQKVRLEWWGNGPPEWRAFTAWAQEIRDFLARCCRVEAAPDRAKIGAE
jgi:hypothetical protein